MTDQVNSSGEILDPDADTLLGESSDGVIPPKGGALSQIGGKSDQQERVSQGRAAMDQLRSQYADASGQASGAYDEQKKTLDSAINRLLGMQVGPSDKEAAYRYASVNGDSAGRYDPGAHNAMEADTLQARREAEMSKNALISQYMTQIPETQLKSANSRMDKLTQQMRIQQSENNAAGTQADKPTKQYGKYFMADPNNPAGPPVFNQEMYDKDISANKDKAKNAAALKVATQNAIAGNMDPDTLDRLAKNWNETGKLDSGLTRGGPAIALKIYKRGQELAQANGDTAQSLLAGQAYRKAQTANLANVTKQYGMFHSFEGTMTDMAAQAKALSNQVDRTNTPIFNDIALPFESALTGNSPLAQFDQKNYTLAMEHAKIMSGSMGNTPVAEGMAKETMKKLRISFGKGTYNDLVNQLITDAQTRNRNMVGNIEGIKAELGGKPPAAPAQPEAANTPASSPLVKYYVALAKWSGSGKQGPAPVKPQ